MLYPLNLLKPKFQYIMKLGEMSLIMEARIRNKSRIRPGVRTHMKVGDY